MLAMFLAAGSVMSTWQLWLPGLVLMIAGTEIRVRVEDRLLASRFGEEFEAYKKRVPAYIPFVR
jgi:protein-S-isoprenylcysteine O-methyltransferase Ste14